MLARLRRAWARFRGRADGHSYECKCLRCDLYWNWDQKEWDDA